MKWIWWNLYSIGIPKLRGEPRPITKILSQRDRQREPKENLRVFPRNPEGKPEESPKEYKWISRVPSWQHQALIPTARGPDQKSRRLPGDCKQGSLGIPSRDLWEFRKESKVNLKTKGFRKEPKGISKEIEIKKLKGSESNSKGIPKNGVSIESQGIRKGIPKELQR